MTGGSKPHDMLCLYWAGQKNLVKGCRQTLDCYCVCCELLSASKADALRFVNMVCLPQIAERNAHEICLTQENIQHCKHSCVRHISWAFCSAISGKQTMFTNRKASALEADNNSQHTQ